MTIEEKILTLKKEKNALILAHFYQIPKIQDIADYVGDSLALAKRGQEAKQQLIIICGVCFMAESAKILSKDKTVLIPAVGAGCPMADMVTYEALKAYKEEKPERYIVSYVNTTAAVKTLSDICVTSSNALNIMKQIEADKILFLPDKNLGGYIKKQLPNKDIELWSGFCSTHQALSSDKIVAIKDSYPDAQILAHPECEESVLQYADFIGSTKGILDYAKQSAHKEFVIATEEGIMHPLQQQNKNKIFHLASSKLICPNMKKIGLEELYTCLKEEKEEILLDEKTIQQAKQPLDKMLSMS